MNRDKSIDKAMKQRPRRRGHQRQRNNGARSGTSSHHSMVFGLCRFLLGVILLSLALFQRVFTSTLVYV
ncbi:hypothetical protein VNO77_05447 [Canavalia gladiata]|uniref:Uncharacterized protein n=1 Tax=Canavalia gladiata TaxID=3824 RepID=A0AAN9N0E9_CANGL